MHGWPRRRHGCQRQCVDGSVYNKPVCASSPSRRAEDELTAAASTSKRMLESLIFSGFPPASSLPQPALAPGRAAFPAEVVVNHGPMTIHHKDRIQFVIGSPASKRRQDGARGQRAAWCAESSVAVWLPVAKISASPAKCKRKACRYWKDPRECRYQQTRRNANSKSRHPGKNRASECRMHPREMRGRSIARHGNQTRA